jgi:glycerol-3-phosphate dehydrogenase
MRRAGLEGIEQRRFDLIVVGGGVNGVGTARDAAMRGLSVLTLEKGDFGSGTSSWSSRLIHGGLRYLEYKEFSLVRESLSDREKLLRIAPHLVKPLQIALPVYEHHKRGPQMIRLGMALYDVLSFDKSMDHHHVLSRKETLRRYPGLDPDGLKSAALYYDAQADFAERIAVENAISAQEHGAVMLNYAKVTRLLVEGGRVGGVEFTDVLTGETHTARAPVIANVSGPWVDEVLAGVPGRPDRMMGGTKGSHFVVDAFPGAPQGQGVYYEAKSDGRPIFIFPWNGRYLIGSTDLRYDGDLDEVIADDDEVDYIVAETNLLFPQANLTADDILFSYSGVRPLPHVGEGVEAGITRRHEVHDHAADQPAIDGLLSVVGGKLTTYRNCSRQTVDLVFKKLGRKAPKSRTAEVPLPGGRTSDFGAFSDGFRRASGLPAATADRLLARYGVCAPDVLEVGRRDPALLAPLGADPAGVIGAEVVYAFERELAQTLADVLHRRTMAGLEPDVGLDVDEAAAAIAVEHLGWSQERAEREVAAQRRYVERLRPRALQRLAAGHGNERSDAGR